MAAGQNKIGLIITGLFLLMGLGYSYYTPLWAPPDEERHLAYSEYIAQHKKLPYLEAAEKGFHIAQALHPPLYYLIGALFCSDNKGLILQQVTINEGPGYTIITPPHNNNDPSYASKAKRAYLLRLLSLVFSALTVYLSFIIILAIFPGDTAGAALGALLIATNPQFLHISAAVSNEPLSTALATLYCLILAYYVKDPFKISIQVLAGIVLGFCLLTKLSTILFIPVTGFAIIWLHKKHWKNLISSMAVIFLIAGALSFWWYLRNWILYNDLIFTRALDALQPWALRQQELSLAYMGLLMKMTFISFWGYFGSMQIPITGIHLTIYGVFIILGCAGLVRMIVMRELLPFQGRILGLLFLSICAGIGFYLQMNLRYTMFMGRYLFVVIAPIAILTAVGLKMLFPVSWRNYILIAIGGLLIAVNLDVLFRVVRPAYADPLLQAGVEQPQFCCPTPDLGSATTIGQSFISPQNNLCAIRVMFSHEAKPAQGTVRFTLKEVGSEDAALCLITVPAKEIEELNKYYFIFPPIAHSRGRRYQFCFDMPASKTPLGISLWYDKNCYLDGTLLINSKPAAGSLLFTTYHFTGDRPSTAWQGKQETVINQGWYINIRELQHYGELSEDFKVKTTTHKKMLRLTKVLENRALQSSPE